VILYALFTTVCVVSFIVLKSMYHSTTAETRTTDGRHHCHQGYIFLLTTCPPPASLSVANQFEMSVASASYH